MLTAAVLSGIITGNLITSSDFLWTLEPTCSYQKMGHPVWSITLGCCCHHPCHQLPPQVCGNLSRVSTWSTAHNVPPLLLLGTCS